MQFRQGNKQTMDEYLNDFPQHPITPNTRYQIRVNGRLSQETVTWFEDMTLAVDETTSPPQTIIQGVIRDQSALYGLISRIRDLGLVLLSVNLITGEDEENGEMV